ncbi:alpha/beta-hydrolase [Gloeophyllum trabeum ATCC 11539]|uniref:Alpha/beta-hydrolase n=1 Tax=Gloeophyllum trabeum (strain ATCC 11539 / FP-39264 / Madison 617) TaxID=670483 RepID=S7QGW0_GLOTA|nr:alpha/beta-hydrolase [Gloeophyllum trabeum ATCC 11539]EPQ58991.1 alpha/beta-hydrolase [Gloeophyllum trabeum ATCC 11539]
MAHNLTTKIVTSSDGAKIYAEGAGNPNGPGIVFVHGLSLTAAVFDRFFEDHELLKEFHLVRYDLRGHGRSAKPDTIEGHASSLYADDFVAVANAFGLKKPYTRTVAADYAQYVQPLPVSGVIYACSLPYVGPIMNVVGLPAILGFLPGLLTTDDVVLNRRTAIEFGDSVWAEPEKVPFKTRCEWVGSSIFQSPKDANFVLTRPQDPAGLFKAGSEGLPLLVLSGTADRQVDGEVLVREMKPHFKDFDAKFFEGAGHAVFYDAYEGTREATVSFVRRVTA